METSFPTPLDDAMIHNLPILYVEDEEEVRDSMMRFLNRRFARVYVAVNGEEGLTLFKKYRPELVITDIKMPRLDGLEMSKEIKAIDPHVPVLITTAFNDVPYLMQAIELKIDGYIKKPINHPDMLAAIHKAALLNQNRRELEARNRLIETILEWHPHLVILTDGTNFGFLNERLLNLLGYKTQDELQQTNKEVRDFIKKVDPSGKVVPFDKEEWERTIKEAGQSLTLCVESRDGTTSAPFVVRFRFFESIGMYLFAFFQ